MDFKVDESLIPNPNRMSLIPPPTPRGAASGGTGKRVIKEDINITNSSAFPTKKSKLEPVLEGHPQSRKAPRLTPAPSNRPKITTSTSHLSMKPSATVETNRSRLVAPAGRVQSANTNNSNLELLQERIRDLEDELSRKERDHNRELERQKRNLESEVEAVEEKYKFELEQAKTKAQRTLSMKDAQIADLQTNVELVTSRVEELNRSNEEKKKEMILCKSELDQLKAELDEKTNRLAQTLEILRNVEEKNAAHLEEIKRMDATQRKLLNDVVDLRGQIRVAVRARPLLEKETAGGASCSHLSYPSATSIKLNASGKTLGFEYQKVYSPNFNQSRVFADVEELIASVLHGYNVSIIAYGQTGSGKTFTMLGNENGSDQGIIPRSVQFLFDSEVKLRDLGWNYQFTTSFFEVYNEEVYDLLNNRAKLDIKICGSSANVDGATVAPISTVDEIFEIIHRANSCRSVAATKCNEQSSRSHAVFELKVQASNAEGQETKPAQALVAILTFSDALIAEHPVGSKGASVSSRLCLVDLAGSERANESGVTGVHFKEMTTINQGLSELRNCIQKQLQKSSHIPYRNSKLTMLLMDSLGSGNSKTMVIVNINPTVNQIAETKRSLEFARDMSMTKIGAATKQEK